MKSKKSIFLTVLMSLAFSASVSFAGEPGGAGAGVGGGGLGDLDFIHRLHPEMSECQVFRLLVSSGQVNLQLPDTMNLALRCLNVQAEQKN